MVLGVSRRAHRSFVAAAHIRHLSNKEAIPQTKLLLPSFHTAASHENDLLQMLVGNLENLPTILYVQKELRDRVFSHLNQKNSSLKTLFLASLETNWVHVFCIFTEQNLKVGHSLDCTIETWVRQRWVISEEEEEVRQFLHPTETESPRISST